MMNCRSLPLLLAAALLAALILCPPAEASDKSATGSVSDFELTSTEGKVHRLNDLLGQKVVLLSFWNLACKPCRREMPELEKIYKELKDKGLEILSINTDGPSDLSSVKPLVRRKGYTYPVLLDTQQKVTKLYNPRCILPYTVIIDLNGKVVYTHVGYNTGDEVALKKKLLSLLTEAGAEPESVETSGPAGADR